MDQIIKNFFLHHLKLLIPFYFTSAFCFLSSALYPQDTIRYMTYNLLNYGLPYNLCDESNNNITLKDQYIKTIFSYTQPDLFAVVEMVEGVDNAQRLLDSAVNAAGPRVFARAAMTNYSNSDIINMLYYDPVKFHLQSQDVIINSLRDINLYNFYLKTSDLSTSQDTLFLTVIIAHLKAGSGQSNEMERADMTLSLMNYLHAQNKQGNIILSGDFNLYSGYEQAYQNLVNYNDLHIRFNDPIDRLGDWNNNADYADVHTQSTHSASNGCAASGGMDDRFDFILTTNPLVAGTEGMQNIATTYRALGNDSQHFNTSITAPPDNISVPAEVLNALYNNSDHLPVIMDIRTAKALSINKYDTDPFGIMITNPVKDDIIIRITHPINNLTIECMDIISQVVVLKQTLPATSDAIRISSNSLKPGLYLLKFSTGMGTTVNKKVIIL